MPEAGQTGDTLPLVNGVARPSLPDAKYAPETTAIWKAYFRIASAAALAASNMAFEAVLVKSQLLSAVYLFLGSALEDFLQAFWRSTGTPSLM